MAGVGGGGGWREGAEYLSTRDITAHINTCTDVLCR